VVIAVLSPAWPADSQAMKHKSVRLEHRLHRPLCFSNHLVGDLDSCFELLHDLRFGLEDAEFLFHECGTVRATDVTDDLFAGTAKTKFVIGSIASSLFADKSLTRQLLQIASP
jgi:hypothetical protein